MDEKLVRKNKIKTFFIIMLLLVIIALSGFIIYDRNFIKKNNDVEEGNFTDKENNDNSNQEQKEIDNQDITTNNSMRYYKSNDDRYAITLISYEKKSLNPKASNSLRQTFIFDTDEYYNGNVVTGGYFIENNKITLIFTASSFDGDCSQVSPDSYYFICNLPGGVPLQRREDGLSYATVDYNEEKITIGDLELIRQP